MIHFKRELKDDALELIKAKDKIDLFDDISDISNHLSALENYPTVEAVLISAQKLDEKMQGKYPIIGKLLDVGNKLASVFQIPAPQYTSKADCLKSYLNQDMYGILCHALIKEKTINSVEDFIDYVD